MEKEDLNSFLKFPTIAEKVLALSKQPLQKLRLSNLAKKFGADTTYSTSRRRICIFDDDSSIQSIGKGRNYKVQCLLP